MRLFLVLRAFYQVSSVLVLRKSSIIVYILKRKSLQQAKINNAKVNDFLPSNDAAEGLKTFYFLKTLAGKLFCVGGGGGGGGGGADGCVCVCVCVCV